jgi:N-acetylglucosaminyldiphosphoundecaprenol N-acetyl-beta-D-mannosaminyltransferase
LEVLKSVTESRFPGVQLVGAYSPPYRPLAKAERLALEGNIRDSRPDIVWIGLGTPKQDVEAMTLAASAPAVFIAVGAAFDFLAGTKKEAPDWLKGSGLEWCYRLLSEPRRLWRRYTLGNLRFLEVALKSADLPWTRR